MKALINSLQNIVGEKYVSTDSQTNAPYLIDSIARYKSECLAIVFPDKTQQVVDIVNVCRQSNISIVPQGGNTGRVGGAASKSDQIILNLSRMNQILDIDPENFTLTAQAGCILSNIQAAAAEHDRLFPLSLGAQGSCQIGGNLATNAGGMNVLHYGNTRDLVLGIEVVLSNGKVWNGLNSLRKNNTGYDLRDLFIGSEGTLGIITAATLKLFPYPQERVVAFVAIEDIDATIQLLGELRKNSSDRLTTFELIPRVAYQATLDHYDSHSDFFDNQYAWYALIVLQSSRADSGLREIAETTLSDQIESESVLDAVIAENERQADKMIKVREDLVSAQSFLGGSIKHDIAVPVSSIPTFMAKAEKSLKTILPTTIIYPYGHIGDGNLHYNLTQPKDMETAEFMEYREKLSHAVHDIALELKGTFSAEHGIGLSKIGYMHQYKDPVEMALLSQIKSTLDPDKLFNPGKLF